MTRAVTIDLDDPGDVERVWQALERRRAVRDADPELRAILLRRCDQMDPGVAEPIRDALDELVPEAVLEAFFHEFAAVSL